MCRERRSFSPEIPHIDHKRGLRNLTYTEYQSKIWINVFNNPGLSASFQRYLKPRNISTFFQFGVGLGSPETERPFASKMSLISEDAQKAWESFWLPQEGFLPRSLSRNTRKWLEEGISRGRAGWNPKIGCWRMVLATFSESLWEHGFGPRVLARDHGREQAAVSRKSTSPKKTFRGSQLFISQPTRPFRTPMFNL